MHHFLSTRLKYALLWVGLIGGISSGYSEEVPSDLATQRQQLIQKSRDSLIFVVGGEFMMGDFGQTVQGKDNDPWQNSKPLHPVRVDSFSMSQYKVTLKDFLLYLQLNPKAAEKHLINQDVRREWNTIYLPYQQQIDGDLPAFMTWPEANAYCQWLGDETGLAFSLPTEAQWEYAARDKGKKVLYATDNGELDEGRNVPSKAQRKGYAYMQMSLGEYFDESLRGKTFQPLGLYPPTPLGFYDMVYNGWEWMNDYYGERYYQFSPQDNPQGEKLPTIWHSARGLEPRTHDYAPTTSRARFYERFMYFPLGMTVRCAVNQPEPLK